jgi:anti-anti-sigma factor
MLKLQKIETPDATVRVALIGCMDLTGVMQVENAFVEATNSPGQHAVIDLSQVDFVSSLGIAMLIRRSNALRNTGLRLILFRPNRDVESVFTKAGLTKLLAIAHDDEGIQQILAASAKSAPRAG